MTESRNMKTIHLFLVCALAGVGNLFAAADARTDLTGNVTDKDGRPLNKATVFIYSAAPKEGSSSLCPYCYADCQKKAGSWRMRTRCWSHRNVAGDYSALAKVKTRV